MLGNVNTLCANWSNMAPVGCWFGVPIAKARLENVLMPCLPSNNLICFVSSITSQRSVKAAVESHGSAREIAKEYVEILIHKYPIWKFLDTSTKEILKKLGSTTVSLHQVTAWWSTACNMMFSLLEFWMHHEHNPRIFEQDLWNWPPFTWVRARVKLSIFKPFTHARGRTHFEFKGSWGLFKKPVLFQYS